MVFKPKFLPKHVAPDVLYVEVINYFHMSKSNNIIERKKSIYCMVKVILHV